MNEVTIKILAAEIQTSVDRLLKQFADAGILKTANDSVSIQEKQDLLEYLNNKQGSTSDKLVLQRKTRSTLNISGTNGKNKSIQIEVRKKQTFLRYDLKEKIYFSDQEKIKDKVKKQELCSEKIQKEKETKIINKHEEDKTNFKDTKKNQENNFISDKKNKINNQIKISRSEKMSLTLKNKIQEEPHRIHIDSQKNWNNKNSSYEEPIDYHFTTSHHARQAEDDNDREVEIGRNFSRKAKMSRHKKNNKHYESKSDREEARSLIRRNKIGKKNKNSFLQQGFRKPIQAVNRDVVIGETITVSELASKMAVKGSQVIKVMMSLGAMVTINQIIDQETAQLVAEEMGHKVFLRHENELEESVMSDRETDKATEPCAPVVTIMGHVDHGKTSLLDRIRSTKMASCEAGGITQRIGAYHVETKNGTITFLDTPGHFAFTAMRSRGAQITDIIVLVVAADDGVMPQTIEAIQHAKEANVPLVVAINKIDKSESDPNRVRNELAQHGIISDKWGGDCQFVHVSAKNGIGIDKLLNAILLQAEILEIKATRKGMASGIVIESFLDRGKGPVSTILIQEGTLNKGDIVLCGFEYGRIRAMRNELGKELTQAGPAIPVEILGLSGLPAAGDKVTVVRDEKKAREVALYRQGKFREVKLARQQKYKLENVFHNNENIGKVHDVNVLLKADTKGSVEAILSSLFNLSTEKVKVKIVSSGVGRITETDAILAAASNAILVGFNVRVDSSARRIIDEENLDLRYYSVIYNLIDEIKESMNGVLSPELKQQIIGLAKVRDVFKSPKFGVIAGCIVTEGVIKRYNPIHVLRDNVVIYEGELESLRRFKDDVNEVSNGIECGINVKKYNDVQVDDVIESFEIVKIQRKLK